MIGWKEFERKWAWCNQGTILAFAWRTEENHEKPQSRLPMWYWNSNQALSKYKPRGLPLYESVWLVSLSDWNDSFPVCWYLLDLFSQLILWCRWSTVSLEYWRCLDYALQRLCISCVSSYEDQTALLVTTFLPNPMTRFHDRSKVEVLSYGFWS
jgi:hypothetical protein